MCHTLLLKTIDKITTDTVLPIRWKEVDPKLWPSGPLNTVANTMITNHFGTHQLPSFSLPRL